MSHRHIVIIEDDKNLSEVLSETFGSLGYKVTVIEDGDDAAEQIVDLAPDIVLLDIMLPGMTGDYVLQHIRQCPNLKNVPVIVFTNFSELPNSIKDFCNILGCKHMVKFDTSLKQITAEVDNTLNS